MHVDREDAREGRESSEREGEVKRGGRGEREIERGDRKWSFEGISMFGY